MLDKVINIIKKVFKKEKAKVGYSFVKAEPPTFWTPEKESELIRLFNDGHTYKEVGLILQATRGQLATKVRNLRKAGIEVKGHKNVKGNNDLSISKNKKLIKEIVDNLENNK